MLQKRRSGFVAPLFSVYSKNSVGIGDLSDLKLLVDLCGRTGDTIVQLLPMNEVGSVFCPYDAISSFAIEPMYLSMGSLADSAGPSFTAMLDKIRNKFPAGKPHVDYRIKDAKLKLLYELYRADKIGLDSGEFKKFVDDNIYWLNDFALFKALKVAHQGRPWYEWEEGYALRDADALEIFSRDNDDELLFHKWVQWRLFQQFKEAKEYANSRGVLLIGDLPILISRDSADVWSHTEFFKLDFVAGAPPDMYCAKGQRWGMPTYDWGKIAADGYKYYKEKLRFAENFYDILRVDHVVGLFRIWSIPYGDPAENEGLNGFFDPNDESVWGEHGRTILKMMLESTGMKLFAEDLGIIPRVCTDTIKEFGIPGNDVQRWTKDWMKRHDFLAPDEYRELSVAMLSTHDTTNWPAWWENEAGTIDEALFIRKCIDRAIDYESVKSRLFDQSRSKHGRLRWREDVSSSELYIGILGRPQEELLDFLDIYSNSYKEKEKLWKHFGFNGKMQEKSDADIVKAALGVTMTSRSRFCIELIFDRLFLGNIIKGDPYKYRINRPGTVSKDNWSITMPLSLEELIEKDIFGLIRKMVTDSGRG